MAAKKRKILNFRQMRVAEIWERDPMQTQENIRKVLEAEFGIKISRVTVSRDLKWMDERNVAKTDAIITATKAAIYEEYLHLYNEALDAWERSLENKEVVTTSETGTQGDTEGRLQTRVEGQSGNPAHHRNALEVLRAIRDLYGLDRVGPGGSESEPIHIKILRGVSMDDL